MATAHEEIAAAMQAAQQLRQQIANDQAAANAALQNIRAERDEFRLEIERREADWRAREGDLRKTKYPMIAEKEKQLQILENRLQHTATIQAGQEATAKMQADAKAAEETRKKMEAQSEELAKAIAEAKAARDEAKRAAEEAKAANAPKA